MLPSARITCVSTCGSSAAARALERVSDIERRRRRPGLRLLCVSGPWPNRAWTSCDNPTLCAPLSASQNKVLSCWEIAVEGCGRSRIVK
jgi:hypothetical protein